MLIELPIALPDALLSRLSDFLASQVGLHFPRERWRDLERGIAAASRESGYAQAEAYIHWLLAAPLTRTQIEGLASHLTVGETYFFREKRGLDILEQQILPQLLRARAQTEKHLRIWSAGCCSGEEPYSIAMLLDRLIPDIAQWNVTILATDINPQFLRKAAQGVYGEWSFRGTPGWLRERYFTRRADGRFEIQPRIRRRVTFSYLNLAEDAYPSLVNNTNAMDVIFCRNVLMYFAPERARNVVDKLQRSLIDGGWLITSPAETSTVLFSAFTAVEFPGAFLYRKMAAGGPRTVAVSHPVPWYDGEAAAPHASAPAAAFSVDRSAVASEVLHEAGGLRATQAEDADAREHDARETPLRNARACADEGRLAEAAEWCEQAIAADKLNPAHYYLHAAICQERGQSETAERSLGRALYLAPDFALAHFALGNLCLSGGRQREARRHFDNALSLLRACPADVLLPESDGLSASRLVEIITSVQASLPRAHKELAA
ncbi:MAG: CheR family methyltransferase [Polaromonas sp.]|uniref:CheR family methyltransferase n=1 Tax=Polaromonas sp. TaxID=1869339 RepID=UPI002731D43A|nr:CheR family methyltransferase [Polaromonas sp.]MDP2256576.1 CheR family methyltransferase [Polaromonas sp.]